MNGVKTSTLIKLPAGQLLGLPESWGMGGWGVHLTLGEQEEGKENQKLQLTKENKIDNARHLGMQSGVGLRKHHYEQS